MFVLKEKIENEGGLQFEVISKNNIVIKDDKGLKKISNENHFYLNSTPCDFLFFNNKIYVTHWDNNYSIIDLTTEKLIETNKSKAFFKISESLIGLSYIESDKEYFGLLDKENNLITKFKIQFCSTQSTLVSNIWVGLLDLHTLIGYNIFIKELLWEIPLKNLGKYKSGVEEKDYRISQFAGSYKKKILATLYNGGIMMADVETGSIIKFWPNTKLEYWLSPSKNNSHIFWGLNHKTFIEIDAEKEIIVRQIDIEKTIKESFQIPDETQLYIFVNTSRVYDGLIYFKADKDLIGVFDPSNEKILWKYKFEFGRSGAFIPAGQDAIQVNGANLYVMDNKGTLYIFNKER